MMHEPLDKDKRNFNFGNADLREWDLSYCDLRGADLSKATIDSTSCFDDAIFDENTKMPDYPMACPTEGEFIGWKQAWVVDHRARRCWRISKCIIKLLIPADAKRSSSTGNKCRCDKAKVLSMERLDDGTDVKEAFSLYNENFVYKTEETVSVDNFDECRWHECAPGIHFFMTKEEAVRYFI